MWKLKLSENLTPGNLISNKNKGKKRKRGLFKGLFKGLIVQLLFKYFPKPVLQGENDLYEYILGKESIGEEYKVMQKLVEIK